MSSSRRWCLFWLALAALLAVRATTRREHRGVLVDHLEFGRRLLAGEDVYGPWRSDPDAPVRPLHAPYPPSFGLLTAPFALVDRGLGRPAARLGWVLLQLLAIAALARSLHAMLNSGPAPPTAASARWLLLGSLALSARFLLRDTHGGGGNVINVALCAAAFVDAERGRDRRAGLWLGISLATKPTQLLLLPLLFVFGHRRAVGYALLTGAACALASLCLLRFDTAPWVRWFEGSLRLAAQTDAFAVPALGFPEFEWMNQSLRCATARYLSAVPAEYAARVAHGVPAGFDWPPAVAAAVARTIVLGLLLWLLRAGHRARRAVATDAAGAAARALAFAAGLCLSLLASPLSWKAHHLALLPLLHLLLARAVASRSRPLCFLLAAFAIGCGLGQEVLGDDGDEWLNSLYVLPAFDLALFAVALRLGATSAPPRPPG